MDCSNCGKLFTNCKILFHEKYYCSDCVGKCYSCNEIKFIYTHMYVIHTPYVDAYTNELYSRDNHGVPMCKNCHHKETNGKVNNKAFVTPDSKGFIVFADNIVRDTCDTCNRCYKVCDLRESILVYYNEQLSHLEDDKDKYLGKVKASSSYSLNKIGSFNIPTIVCYRCYKHVEEH